MKFIQIILLSVFLLIAKGHNLVPYKTINCTPILPHLNSVQTTFLDLDEDSEELKTCLMKNILLDQTLLVITGYYTNSNPTLQKHRTSENPNVIIMSKQITSNVVHLPSVRRVLRYHRSIVFIAITNDKRFKCEDGALNASDFSSLETFMNEIWHRYRIMHVTAIFPLTCRDKVAVYSGKKVTNQILYDRTINLIDVANMHEHLAIAERRGHLLTQDYPLKANIFYRYPTSITNCKDLHYYTKVNLSLTEGYCGLDALVMHDIVKHFKFNLHFPKDDNCYKYGYEVDNMVIGSLGCIVRKELDISFNSRFMTMYSADHIYFLHYIKTESFCAMVKRAEIIPVWFYAMSVYSVKLWLLIISLIVAIGIFTWVGAIVEGKITRSGRASLYFYIKDTFTSTMLGFTLRKKEKLYLLRGICLCCSILFVAIFQGHVNHVFTALHRYETINTLSELYQSDKVLYISQSMKEILKQLENPENKPEHIFMSRARLAPENDTLDFVVRYPQAAIVGRRQDAEMEILGEYVDENDSPLIHIVNECFYVYYLAYITRSGFPFVEELQRFMQRIGEAGLPIIYHKWTCNILHVPPSLPKLRNEPRPFSKINLNQQRVAFGLLLLGYTVSVIIFIIELIRGRREC